MMEKELEKPVRQMAGGQQGGAGLRTLEKKNLELNNATKQLEAKMKTLQQKTATKVNRSLPKVRAVSAPPARELPTAPRLALERQRRNSGNIVASNVTSRIREREAEIQKQVQDRDEQISRLKERLKALSKRLGEIKEGQKDLAKLNSQQENGHELQSIIRQVTKERLQLERHLQIANDSLQRNNGVDLQRVLSLEQTNNHLRIQLDSLDLLQQEHRLVEIQYREKEEACKELLNTLKYKSALCEDLETQLAKVIEKNAELAMVNSDLQRKVVQLQDATVECETLKSTLSQVERECTTARTEVRSLSGKVRNLESVLEEMHKAGENRREIERQHKEALENLKRRQGEVETVATKKQAELIDQLKRKIGDLETEKRVQNERHTELILEMAELKKYGGGSSGGNGGSDSLHSDVEQPSDNLEIDEIMAKLEQDNKFLADLEKQRAERKGESPPHRTSSSTIADSGFLSQSSLNGSSTSPSSRHSNGSLNKLPGMTKADKINLLHGSSSNSSREVLNGDNAVTTVEKDGMIEIPGKGLTYVYIARYSYDPFQHSPNDSPEAELQVNAGDYILVWGDVDEDGFYDGELLDGRRGLVPSNFVEKLEGEDLIDFHQQVILGLGDCDDSVCTSIPQDLDFLSSDDGLDQEQQPRKLSTSSYFHSAPPLRKGSVSSSHPMLPQYASCTDLDVSEDEGETNASSSSRIPPPRQLTIEALQNKSLVIAWNPPSDFPAGKLDCYQVMVDGSVQCSVLATEKSLKATVPGVDASLIHRISVKVVGTNSKMSNEAACTMVIGKDAPLGPTGVKASTTTSTSCTLVWIPSNTNFMHAICVNNVEVKTVKPGVFRHTLAGLQPNTSYKVTIRAKNIKAAPYIAGHNLKQLQNLSSTIEIRTQPQGLPEAPVDVQVDKGPRDGTLLVTWLPVTINPTGTSNGAPVTGYVVYADGKRMKDVESGTADQAVIEIGRPSTVRTVSVRTKSMDKLSKESDPCLVPSFGLVRPSLYQDGDDESDSEGELGGGKAPKQNLEVVINYSSGYPELDSDIGPSELSDIAEEPEEGLTDNEDRDSITPQNNRRNKMPSYDRSALYQPNNNALNHWNNNKTLAASSTATATTKLAASQFSAQPMTTSSSNSSLTYVSKQNNNVFRPTIHITQNDPVATQKPIAAVPAAVAAAAAERIRIFVALFDYDPQTMSPNPDACDEELPFREGQLIKIFGDKDGDGFYWGEAGQRTGYVPCNMVSEVQVDDDHVAEELFREQSHPGPTVTGVPTAVAAVKDNDRWGDIYEASPAKRKLALYDYDPTELSPNVDSEVELSFRTGDLILVYGEMDDDGFFMGELNGKRGLVPSNFLTDVPAGYDPKHLMRLIAANNNGAVSQSSGNGTQQQQPRVLGQQKRW